MVTVPYGHVASLLVRCACGRGYVATLLEDGTAACAKCGKEEATNDR